MRSLFLTCLLFLAITPVNAAEFRIEEDGLRPVPKAIDSAIRKLKELESDCNLIGKPIDLSGQGKKTDFVVTTANACDWGASAGPVWVVRNNQVVLSASTYSLKLQLNKSNGLFDVQTSHGSAGIASAEFWSFTGTRYKVKQSYSFTPDDEKTCKAHKDICPYEFK